MTDYSIILMFCLAIIALMAILIYRSNCSQESSLADVRELRQTLDQVLAGTRSIESTLEKHRRVLYDAHKQISAVTKGVKKLAS